MPYKHNDCDMNLTLLQLFTSQKRGSVKHKNLPGVQINKQERAHLVLDLQRFKVKNDIVLLFQSTVKSESLRTMNGLQSLTCRFSMVTAKIITLLPTIRREKELEACLVRKCPEQPCLLSLTQTPLICHRSDEGLSTLVFQKQLLIRLKQVS